MAIKKRSIITFSVIIASFMGLCRTVEASDETKVAQNTQQPVFSKEVRTGPAGENEMIGFSSAENYWWDTTHNQHFTFGSDYMSGPWLIIINRTEGYLDLGETLDLSEGWKFINITYKGQVYQVGDRIFDTDLIYDDNKTSKENDVPYEAAMNQLRYNYEPLEFNVRISYSGLPENVKATLPTTDATPILSGSMYKIPQAPKVAGFSAKDYVEVPAGHLPDKKTIGSDIYVAGGTVKSQITYVYEQEPDSPTDLKTSSDFLLRYLYDTTHDMHIIMPDYWQGYYGMLSGSYPINLTKGYLEILYSPYNFDSGWKFVNITYKDKIYKVGDKIYDTAFLGRVDKEELYKNLHFNYVPLEFNVKFNYRVDMFGSFPEDIMATLPESDPTPILSGSMYRVPKAPEVPGYTFSLAYKYREHIYLPIEVETETYVAGGTRWDNITYVYTKIKDPQPVVSTYVDTQGNVISEAISITGDLGAAYTTTAKTIPGYTLVKVDGPTSGKYTETKQEVVYTYINDATYEFKDTYLDYSANTVVSISDLDKQFKIVKNVNLSLLSYENGKINFRVIGTSQGNQLLGTIQTVSKRLQTKNGSIYYVIEIDGKKYALYSDAFQSMPTASDLTQEFDLAKYSGVSLDFKGNHLEKMNTVDLMLTLGSNYNVYDLLKTSGDAAISPFAGTTAGLGIQGSTFNITQEFISNHGSKYYKVIVNSVSLIINAAAFMAN